MSMLLPTLLVGAALVATPVPQAPTSPPAKPPVDRPTDRPATPAVQADRGKPASGLSAADTAFVKKAADGGMAEVALAKLAQTKASNAEVKAFAQKLEQDHSKANDELKTLAQSKQVTLPNAPSKMHQTKEDKLSKLSGAAFDRAYIADMLADHKKDVAEFERQSTHAADADVKAFAAKTLPTLKDHLQQVEQLSKTIGRASS
jgi:putative membrane protein